MHMARSGAFETTSIPYYKPCRGKRSSPGQTLILRGSTAGVAAVGACLAVSAPKVTRPTAAGRVQVGVAQLARRGRDDQRPPLGSVLDDGDLEALRDVDTLLSQHPDGVRGQPLFELRIRPG